MQTNRHKDTETHMVARKLVITKNIPLNNKEKLITI